MIDILTIQFIGWLIVVGLLIVLMFQIKKQLQATNSRLNELLKVTDRLARLEGFEAGRESRKKIEAAGDKLSGQNDPS